MKTAKEDLKSLSYLIDNLEAKNSLLKNYKSKAKKILKERQDGR